MFLARVKNIYVIDYYRTTRAVCRRTVCSRMALNFTPRSPHIFEASSLVEAFAKDDQFPIPRIWGAKESKYYYKYANMWGICSYVLDWPSFYPSSLFSPPIGELCLLKLVCLGHQFFHFQAIWWVLKLKLQLILITNQTMTRLHFQTTYGKL